MVDYMLDVTTIEKYDYVSFDIFDTLIKRLVLHPTDVFRYVERYHNNYVGFYEERMIAEKKARSNTKREEVTLDEIYSYIPNGKFKDKNELMHLEINAELRLCVANKEVLELYYKALNLKKKVILISDMYLDDKSITAILKKCGITGYNKLYISSMIGYTKSHGTLYEYIQREMKIDFDKWIHIGDNECSDYKRPMSLGISALLYKRGGIEDWRDNKKIYSMEDSVLFGQLNLANYRVDTNEKQIGYAIYGPILYGFSKWLFEKINDKKISNILFVSRDCYIIKRLFDIWGYNKKINTRYFLASRRSLWLASYEGNVNLESFYKRAITEFPESFKIKMLVSELNLSEATLYKLKNELTIDLEYVVCRNNVLIDEMFLKFWGAVNEELNQISLNEYDAFNTYVNKLNLDLNKEIAFVDIGWRGTMQMMLESMMKKRLHGYYFGIDNNYYQLNNVSAYVTDWDNFNLKPVHFLEMFFSAPHPSLNKYKLRNDGTVEFVYKKSENNEDVQDSLGNIRLGAIEFCKDFSSNSCASELEFSPEFLIDNLLHQLKFPSLKDVLVYEKIKFYDTEVYSFIQAHGYRAYLRNPLCFYRDFRKSIWKTGFLKKVIKLNLPYYAMLLLFRKIRNVLS